MKKKKSRNIGYLFKEGFRGIFLHGFMSFASICVTVACLIIIGSFSSILYNLNLMVDELEQQNEIRVYIDENYSNEEALGVGTVLNTVPNVEKAVFITREDALDSFVRIQQDSDAFAGVNADTLRDRYQVTLVDNSKMTSTVAQIKTIEGVVAVSDHPELAEGFTTIQRVLNIASVVIIVVLLVVSLFIISNTIKLAMFDRRDEIAIMKMVGATNGFIRFPYVIEGFIIGIFSAAIAFFAQWGLYSLIANAISSVDSLGLFTVVSFSEMLLPMVITFGIAGFFIGVVGSLLSIRKFLDV